MFLLRLIIILFCICLDDNSYILHIGVRANIHLGGGGVKTSFAHLPEWRTQIVCYAAPPGRKNNNELLQCLFLTILGVVHNCQHLPISTQSTNLGEGGGLRRASVLFFKC